MTNPKWPALDVEERATSALRARASNPRTHDDKQVAQIAASIEQWGWTIPVLIDEDGGILAGHGRVLAAEKLGILRVPCVVARGWTEEQRRAYVVADNQLAANSAWNRELLKVELLELREAGFDVELLGIKGSDRAKLEGTEGLDVVPAVPTEPRTKRGDLIVLGRHRLFCGDSTVEAQVDKLRDGAVFDLVLTDPPYCSGGFNEMGRSVGSVGRDIAHKPIANDRLSTRGYQALLKQAFTEARARFLYAFTDWRMWVWIYDVVESCGFRARSMLVWDKGRPGMGQVWRTQHELIIWACKDAPPVPNTYAGAGNVLQAPRTSNEHHTTEKPVGLLVELLGNTPFASTVYDPFAGSGSTLLACEQAERQCFAMEMDPAYCDVVVQRWEAMTGERAKRSGQPASIEDLIG
jgi:DNA modification methylase